MARFEGSAVIVCARGEVLATVSLQSWTGSDGSPAWGGRVTGGDDLALSRITSGMGSRGLVIRLAGERAGRFIPDIVAGPGGTRVDISGTGPVPF